MTYRRATPYVAAMALAVLLAACAADQPPPEPFTDGILPGFLLGLWHGFIAPVTFVVSLFVNDVRIYAFPNVGRWYDFGFMLGIGGFSGGLFAGSRGRRRG